MDGYLLIPGHVLSLSVQFREQTKRVSATETSPLSVTALFSLTTSLFTRLLLENCSPDVVIMNAAFCCYNLLL